MSGNRTDTVYHNVIVSVNNFVPQMSGCRGCQSILGFTLYTPLLFALKVDGGFQVRVLRLEIG